MLTTIMIITFLYLIFKLLFAYFLTFLKLNILWILIEKDEYPNFKKKKIQIFFYKTFDKKLGWNWKLNSMHKEKIFSKTIKIFFGKFGERKEAVCKKEYKFTSFGDLFVFCRYVENKETWREKLSCLKSFQGLNLGVGNYGLDQIYLKENESKL